MTAQRGKAPERLFASIYRDLSEYPSEHVAEVIEALRLMKKSITTKDVRDALASRARIVARVAEHREQHDAAHLMRVAVACAHKRDTLDEKIARCMTRRGISKREENLYQEQLKRYPIAGWGYYPPSNWFERECRCGESVSANHDLADTPASEFLF